MKDDFKTFIPLNLHFFDEGEKTEQPTSRKRSKAREEGQVAKSQEIGTAFLFIATFFALKLFAGSMLDGLLGLFNYPMELIPDMADLFESVYLANLISFLFAQIMLLVLPMFAVVMVVGIVTNLIQVGWKVTTKPLRPKFSKMNPLKGFKRIFSMQTVVTLIKSLLKFGMIGLVIYNLMKDELVMIPAMLDMSLEQAVAYIGDLIINMGLMVGVMYVFIAAIDYAYTRYKHTKSLKMTKQEVKEEYKSIEGNPQIKGKIKQKMREVSMRRMMQNVPKADVIITNPTHYAVALRYDRMRDRAPVLVAKGVDYMAKRIKDVGRENNVEIVENPPLARAIYADVDVDREIPPELWEAVADIIAFVFRMKNKL